MKYEKLLENQFIGQVVNIVHPERNRRDFKNYFYAGINPANSKYLLENPIILSRMRDDSILEVCIDRIYFENGKIDRIDLNERKIKFGIDKKKYLVYNKIIEKGEKELARRRRHGL